MHGTTSVLNFTCLIQLCWPGAGRYLSYVQNGGLADTRVTLKLPSAILKPPAWRVRSLGNGIYRIDAGNRPQTAPATLSYSGSCGSTSVKATTGTLQRWRLVPVDVSKGIYRINAQVGEITGQ
jgi:hypothetical protein